jgi:quercetin dioxygenase-like cupin family protein
MMKVSWMGTDYSINVAKADSAGTVGVFESVTPAGDGPPVHIHNNEDEVLHVIDGEFEFWLDGQVSRAAQGRSVFLPRGVPHTFRVVGDRPGRILAITVPGGFENFFVEVSERDLRIPDNMPELMELAGRYGLQFVGPAQWAD